MACSKSTGIVAVVRGTGENGVAVSLLDGDKQIKQYTLPSNPAQEPNRTRKMNPQTPPPLPYQMNDNSNFYGYPPIPPIQGCQPPPMYNYQNYPCPYFMGNPANQANQNAMGSGRVNVGTGCDTGYCVKQDTGVQATDGRYASTYRIQHCKIAPTSPEVLPAEFPPQRPQLCPGRENFVVGGGGSGETIPTWSRSTEFRGAMTWPDRGSVCMPRTSQQLDPFASSLRKYPPRTLSSERSAEIVERLVNYSQVRNMKPKPSMSSSSRVTNVEAYNLRQSFLPPQTGSPTRMPHEDRPRSGCRVSALDDRDERRCRQDIIAHCKARGYRYKTSSPSPLRRTTSPMPHSNNEDHVPKEDTTETVIQNLPDTITAKTTIKPKQENSPPLDNIHENDVEQIETVKTTASFTEVSFSTQQALTVRKSKSHEVILTDSAEKFRKEILGCFEGISLVPSRDPKERVLRQGLLKKLTRKLNKLCELYKARYKNDIPMKFNKKEVLFDKVKFSATLKTIIDNPCSNFNRNQQLNVYLLELPNTAHSSYTTTAEFNEIVRVWLYSIDMYASTQEKKEVLEQFLTRLKIIYLNSPPNNIELKNLLRIEVMYLLDCLPLTRDSNNTLYKNNMADHLINKLMMLPKLQLYKSTKTERKCTADELKRLVSRQVSNLLHNVDVELFDQQYLEFVKQDLFDLSLDALNDIYMGDTVEIEDDVAFLLQESLNISITKAHKVAQTLINAIQNASKEHKEHEKVSKPAVRSETSLVVLTPSQFMVYRSREKSGAQSTSKADSKVSIFEPSRVSDNNQDNYEHDVSVQIDEWLASLHLADIPNKSLVVSELASDIADRNRYLQMNSIKPPNHDLEYLKYQIFKNINKSIGEDHNETITNAPDLMRRIQSLPAPDLNQSHGNSKGPQSSRKVEVDEIQNLLIEYIASTPLYKQRSDSVKKQQEQVMIKLAQRIAEYKKSTDLSKSDADTSMIHLITLYIKTLPLDNGKHFCCMRTATVESTAKHINEMLNNMLFYPDAAPPNYDPADDFLRQTVAEWLIGLPLQPFQNAAEAQNFRDREEDFIQRLKNSRNSCCSEKKITTDIESFIMTMPFDCGKKCDSRFINSEVVKLYRMLDVVPLQELNVSRRDSYGSFMDNLQGPTSSKLGFMDNSQGPTSSKLGFMDNSQGPTSSKLGLGSDSNVSRASRVSGKLPMHVHDMINKWADDLYMKAATPQEKAAADNAKKNVAQEIRNESEKIANDPKARSDRFLMEDILEPKIDSIIDKYIPPSKELKNTKHAKKVKLMQDLGDYFQDNKDAASADQVIANDQNKLKQQLARVIPNDHPSLEKLRPKLLEAYIKANSPNATRAERDAAQRRLQELIDEIYAVSPSLKSQTKEKFKKNLLEALAKIAPHDSKVYDSKGNFRKSLRDILSQTLPPRRLSNQEKEAMDEIILDDLIDIFIKMNHSGNDDFERLVYKDVLLDQVIKLLQNVAAGEEPIDQNELQEKILKAMESVPKPNDEDLNNYLKEIIIKEELADWFEKLPVQGADSPESRLERNKHLEYLAAKLIAAEKNRSENTKELLKREITEWLKDAPFVKKENINFDKMADEFYSQLENHVTFKPQANTTGRQWLTLDETMPSGVDRQKIHEFRENIKKSIDQVAPIPKGNRELETALENLIDSHIDQSIHPTPLQKEEASRHLNKFVDELHDASPSLKNHKTSKQIESAIKIIAAPDKKALEKVKSQEISDSNNTRHKIKDAIKKSLPRHQYKTANEEALIEIFLDDIVDNIIKMNHTGNDDTQRAAFEKGVDKDTEKYLDSLVKQGVPINKEEVKPKIYKISRTPVPDNELRNQVKAVVAKNEVADWFESLPVKPAATPKDRLVRNREIEELVDKILEAENEAGSFANAEQDIIKAVEKWLRDAPLTDKNLNHKKLANDLSNRLKQNQAYHNPEVPLPSSKNNWLTFDGTFDEKQDAAAGQSFTNSTAERFKKASDDLYTAIAEWTESIPLPSEEDKVKARQQANKLTSKISDLLSDPKTREDSFLFQTFAENEIDNMLDSLPENPELESKREQLVKTLLKKLNQVREKASGEYSVYEYKKQVADTISNQIPMPCDSCDGNMVKENLADAFIQATFEPMSSSQKKKANKRLNRAIDDALEASSLLCCQPKDKSRQAILSALKKIPAPEKKYMLNELAEIKLKREVSDFIKELRVKPDKKNDKVRVNKMKTTLAKCLHDLENRLPVESEEYTTQMSDAITKWANKLPLQPDQEKQLPDLVQQLVSRLKSTYRKRRDNLVSRLFDEDSDSDDSDRKICCKCKQKIVCKRSSSRSFKKGAQKCAPQQLPPSLGNSECFIRMSDCYMPPPPPPPACYRPSSNSHIKEYYTPQDSTQLPSPLCGRPPPQNYTKAHNPPGCRRPSSQTPSPNPPNCFWPYFCPRCYALGRPCNNHSMY